MLGGSNPQLGNRMSQHQFAMRPDVQSARSVFDRSHAMKDTFNFDYLTPIFLDEVLPGDTCNLSVNTFARLATQLVPVMDNMYIDYFFFFVPNRLTWIHWEKFCGAQDNPGDSISFTIPTVTGNNVAVGTLWDKFGLPTTVSNNLVVNALPFRAYNLIWNEWFRDQNLQDSVTVETDDGPDTLSNTVLLQRGKRHDYFTSCLPFLQKGTAISMPLGTSAPVLGDGTNPASLLGLTSGATRTMAFSTAIGLTVGTGSGSFSNSENVGFQNGVQQGLYADLTTATAATINQLRSAIQIQSLLELDARGGTRYVELLKAHFNVTSPDFRLQRPEYLGGGSQKISSNPVPNTTTTGGQGKLAAFGTAASNGGIGFTKAFQEHGYVIGLACARADLTYQQGVNRLWSRSTRYDYFWPKLQELGEQAVLTGEIYALGTSADAVVFGYQERYAEYRFKPSEIHGEFRSTYSTPLDYWHLAEEFSAPALNAAFIVSSTPISRIVYDTSAPHLLWDGWFIYKHARAMVTYSTPVSLGRF